MLENWQREGDKNDDQPTDWDDGESFYFNFRIFFYNISHKDSWVLNGLGEPTVKNNKITARV